ncbi:MAG: type II secretion protein F [Actinomycetes bacterium]|nr:type II secretion protein F [Actinomycetes bacterium]
MVAVMAVAFALWVLASVPPRLPRQGRRRERVRTARNRAEPDVGAYVAEVATRLRSGVSTREAWDRTALRWGLRAGVGDDGVPYALADLPPGAAVAGARAAARLAAELGSPLADMLDACADGLTRAEENEAARRIALAGPVASARLLAALPVVGLALGTLIGADPIGQLLGGGLGSAAGVAGVLLMGVGARWSRGLVAAARAGRL